MNAHSARDGAGDDWGPLSGLPGNPVMWLLIASELVVFGALFAGFGIARIGEPDVFARSQDHLDRLAGAINTMVLITSGLCAALAVSARISGNITRARLWLAAAGGLGLLFLAVKVMEYADKFRAGISTETSSFFMLYFLSTGFHAVHVVFGMIILAIAGWKCSVENIITGTAFWHMVDLIWVILFPVAYLMR